MYRNRPRVAIERTPVDHVLEGTALVLLLVSLGYLVYHWGRIPGVVPTHIDSRGVIDAWGGKLEMLILPAVMVIDFILLSVLQRFPHTHNSFVKITEENAERQYRISVSMLGWMNVILAGGMGLLLADMTDLAIQGTGQITGWLMPAFMGALFGVLIIFMGWSWRER